MRYLIAILLCVVVSSGCQKPAAPGGNAGAGSNGGAGAASASQLQPRTVGNISLSPIRVLPALEILIPDGFSEMDDDMMRSKYPGPNSPAVVYTNEAGSVNIAFNHTQDRASPSQLQQLHQQLDNSIRQAQPNARWMFSGRWHHHGREWVQLEFQSQAIDTTVHNMMIATPVEGRILIVSFNCTDELSGEWLGVGREIIGSSIANE
ncbi:MAG: hypothetical protein AAF456_12770 [Planctomycetota bacterium]